MRTLLALTVLASSLALTVLPACNIIGGCGGYAGGGDSIVQRTGGTDTILLCENGGFVAKLDATEIDGLASLDSTTLATRGVVGATKQLLFTLTTDQTTGIMTAPELGPDTWTYVDLDKTALDHADALCQNLTAQSWWPSAAQQ